MKTKTSSLLVLTWGQNSVHVAQAAAVGSRYRIKHSATFVNPEGLGLEQPEALGRALHAFLHQEHIHVRHAVVGIPSKWLVAKSVTIPPTRMENLRGLMEIQAEQVFSLGVQELVYDISGSVRADQSSTVLLVAMQRQRLNQIQATLKAAHLNLLSVMPLAAATVAVADGPRRVCGIYAQNGHAEYVLAQQGALCQIKHVTTSVSQSGPEAMAADLQRLLLLTERDPDGAMDLVVWSPAADDAALTQLRQRLGERITIRNGRAALEASGQIAPDSIGTEDDRAAALIGAYCHRDVPALDFLHSHLAAPPKKTQNRVLLWGVSAALVVLLAVAAVYAMWTLDRRDIARFQQQLQDNKTALEQATDLRDRLKLTARWYAGRAKYLGGLDALTQIFPQSGSIWVTNLSFQDDGTAGIDGEAVDRPSVLGVLKAMQASDHFTDIKTHNIDEVDKTSKEVRFSIGFKIVNP